jgi:predicted ATPase
VAVHRLVSVIGAGGIGKTRLAQAVAHRLRDDYAGGVWIVELAPLTDPALLPAAVAQARGLTLPGKKAPLEEVIEALGDRPMLLVLDNCEHVVEAAGRFASAVMERTAQLRLLTTSQELLKLTDEQVFRASPLSLPSSNLGSAVEASGAGKLLIHRIGALRRGFALDDTGTADAVEICRRLDGLPLAIELAAGRVPLLGLAGVRELLDERFRVLTGGSRTGLRRHRTLRETLEWSHALLNPDEAAVFRRAAVFAGGFGLKQAQTVLGDEHLDEWAVLELLGAVVDKSLIMVDPVEPPRYRLLESARAFALEKLQDAGEGEATRRRHAQAVLDQFNATFPTQWDAPSQRRTELYLPDLDNCRAALDWAAQGAAELHIALAGACAWLFGSTGQAMEGMRHCERALKRIDSGTPASAEARLQYAWCGLAHYSPGPEKRAAAERAVALYRAIDDVPALYCALGRFAITAALSDDGAAGEEATIEMERLQDRAWPLLARWDLLNARDYVLNMLLRHAEAEALAHEELALALATGDTAKTMFSLMALEQCASTRGDFEEAVTRGRELVAMARRERYVERMQVYVANLATALVMAGQVDEGHVVAREAAGLDSRAGTLWLSLDYLAMLAHKQGRSVDAARVLGRSDAANAWRKACREPVEKRVHDELLRNLQALIPAGELDRLLARGAAMTDEAAAALALDG